MLSAKVGCRELKLDAECLSWFLAGMEHYTYTVCPLPDHILASDFFSVEVREAIEPICFLLIAKENLNSVMLTDHQQDWGRPKGCLTRQYVSLVFSPLNFLGFTLMFSVIYYQLFRVRLFRYFVLSLHLKSIPLFRTCKKQSTYITAQLETYA